MSTPAIPGNMKLPANKPLFTLIRIHTRAQVLEQLRIPVAVLSSTVFPTLALVFFVLPQTAVTSNPEASLISIAQLAVFGVMSAFLFNYGIGVAEERANPWSSYVRTLPAGAFPATVARAVTAMMFAFFALIPVLAVGAATTAGLQLYTDGTLSWWRIPASVAVWLLCGLPFLFLGLLIGYLCTSKVAIALTQVVFFPLAFAGGMMLPPAIFSPGLNTFSLFLPSRAARDISVSVFSGTELAPSSVICFLAWTILLCAGAVWANRRDQGRRFR
ncbi:hypothetical protein GCM10009636_06590 [Arthrobacter koreensis]|uniref:ABC transporter permease n=1 Tax=Arthrobacter koreensis TaxID=199136 RepID=UPI000A8BFD93|nr:ABC transporter permease [Arthrobacter koreensis]MDF2498127.1 transporter [Arthrobacter koreensis]